MTKRTSWSYIIGLTWLATITLLGANFNHSIPNKVVSLSVSIFIITIATGASLIGLYRLKKKKY